MGKRRFSNRQWRAIHAKRSAAARKGWNTRTRREGYRQVGSAVASLASPVISTGFDIKDLSIGATKAIFPKKARKSKKLKAIDRI